MCPLSSVNRRLIERSGVAHNLAIVTVTWRDLKNTCACIWSVLAGEVRPAFLIVVDNGSADGTREGLERFLLGERIDVFDPFAARSRVVSIQDLEVRVRFELDGPELANPIPLSEIGSDDSGPFTVVRLISADHNAGFSAGNNVGVAALVRAGYAGAVWLLNNDAYVATNCIEELCRKELPGISGTVLVEFDDVDRIQAAGGYLSPFLASPRNLYVNDRVSELIHRVGGGSIKASYPIGASMLTWMDLILRDVGWFFEGYFLYFEEADFAARHQSNSVDIYLDCLVAHLGGVSTAEKPSMFARRSVVRDFYSARARVIFVQRNKGSIALSAVVVFLIAQATKRLVMGDLRACSAVIRGIWQGLTFR